MRRILLVLAVAALMAVMMVAMAAPAFAKHGYRFVHPPSYVCSNDTTGDTVFPVAASERQALVKDGYNCSGILS